MTAVGLPGVDVSRETVQTLLDFEMLLRKWTTAINLVSKSTVSEIWQRHISDSAQIFQYLPAGAKNWLDLGSGGGFPGIVVSILARELAPGLRVTLVESDRRKATFLRQAAQQFGLDVVVLDKRIESIPPQAADVLSARALSPLSDLLSHASTHLHPAGVAIFPKGARYNEELAEARSTWVFDVEIKPSCSDPGAAILVIRNIHRAAQA